ncbi:MAG: ribosome maturation factor RimM [Anaerovoracaceae bacterium]|jgi:16S rRNA processing protein RimM
MAERILIGTVIRAVGLRGELKLRSYAEDPRRFEKLTHLYLRDTAYPILRVRRQKGMPVVLLDGIDSRDAAESLRGCDVEMDAAELEETSPGEYYIRDLLHADVVLEDGRPLGILEDIRTDSPQPLCCIRLREDGRLIYLPGVPAFIRAVEAEKGRVTVRLPKGLLEL